MRRYLIAPAQLIPRCQVSALFASPMARNELYCDVERALRVQLDDAELGRAHTFGALVAYLGRVPRAHSGRWPYSRLMPAVAAASPGRMSRALV